MTPEKNITIFNDDCLAVLKKLASNSIDTCVTDSPYGYSFMGNHWDVDVPSVDIWREVLRVLKPGAFVLNMSAPRQDVLSRMICRMADAGLDTRFSSLYWMYLNGFPKGLNMSKAVDKKLNAKREKINVPSKDGLVYGQYSGIIDANIPISEQAKALHGSYAGCQLKPSCEIVCVAQKPIESRSYTEQALANGRGITWPGECRIPLADGEDISVNRQEGEALDSNNQGWGFKRMSRGNEGRFPANVIVSDQALGEKSKYFDLDAWAENSRLLPESCYETFPALFVPKPSPAEKHFGCDSLPTKVKPSHMRTKGGTGTRSVTQGFPDVFTKNDHPTVKPIRLMAFLITLALGPTDGTVLDPFMGSATTGIAARLLGKDFIGIEREAEYFEIAKARISAVDPGNRILKKAIEGIRRTA